MADIPLIAPQGKARSTNLNAQRTINLYPVMDQGGKYPVALYGTPGLDLFATVGTGPIRGCLEFNGTGYVVSGNKFYAVSSTGAATSKGTLATSYGRVQLATNGLQVMVVDGSGYVYDIGAGTFGSITDPDFPGGVAVTYMDGYGIFT